jgi:hypothetical protein
MAQDTDGDGILDEEDNCLLVANASQVDSNVDGFGNACDPDVTNDGVVGLPDLIRVYPLIGAVEGESLEYDAELDLSGDGAIGIPEFLQINNWVGGPPGPSGLGDDLDVDKFRGDGFVDLGFDNCSEVDNPDQADSDGDLFGNGCDPDYDSDGVYEQSDFDLFLPHRGHSSYDSADENISNDGSGNVGIPEVVMHHRFEFGDPPGPSGFGDNADRDGLIIDDNCPYHANNDQLDTDGDGIGDACDDD